MAGSGLSLVSSRQVCSGQPGLDVLARGAAGVAGWQQVEIDGAALLHGGCAEMAVQQIGQGGHIARRSAHCPCAPVSSASEMSTISTLGAGPGRRRVANVLLRRTS